MIYLIVLSVLAFFILWGACIAGARADELTEEIFRNEKQQKQKTSKKESR